MGFLREAEAAGASVSLGCWKDGLQVLALILRRTRVLEAADLWVFPEYPE